MPVWRALVVSAWRFCLPRRAASLLVVTLTLAWSLTAIVFAADNHRITQKNRAFSLNSITIAKGDAIQFVNDDEFIHQVYVEENNVNFNFDTAESSPGDTITIPFTVAGTFEVHCHIHPKMRLVVTVQ